MTIDMKIRRFMIMWTHNPLYSCNHRHIIPRSNMPISAPPSSCWIPPLLEEERNPGSQALIANLIWFSMGCCLINLYEFIKNPKNNSPFMAGGFTIQTQDNRSAGHIYEMFRQSSRHSCPISTLASRQECLHLHTRGKTSGFGRLFQIDLLLKSSLLFHFFSSGNRADALGFNLCNAL